MNWKTKKRVKKQGWYWDFWYGLAYGEDIVPSTILTDEKQIEELHKAVDLISSFEQLMETENIFLKLKDS